MQHDVYRTPVYTLDVLTEDQGASVADAFINEPGWKIRGISRDPSKQTSRAWSDKGVEMVAADLDYIASLEAAFEGSAVIFGVTDFWQQIYMPANQKKAQEMGKTVNIVASEAEIQHGKNIVDAAQATTSTLDMLVLSVVPDSKKWSHGKITWNYHFEGKWKIIEYLEKEYPELYKKTSTFQPPFYIENLDSMMVPRKVSFTAVSRGGLVIHNRLPQTPDGSYVLSYPLDGNKLVPMYHARNDSGPLVKALVKSVPGKNLMGYGSLISFDEIAEIWSQNLGSR